MRYKQNAVVWLDFFAPICGSCIKHYRFTVKSNRRGKAPAAYASENVACEAKGTPDQHCREVSQHSAANTSALLASSASLVAGQLPPKPQITRSCATRMLK
jgi:hypothetical protein